MFIEVDKSWKTIMRRVQKNPTAIRAATQNGEWVGQVGGVLGLIIVSTDNNINCD